jgi:methyl-accepting chemotaxis protein
MVIPIAALVGTQSTPADASKAKLDLDKALDEFNLVAKAYEASEFDADEADLWKRFKVLWQRFVDMSYEMVRLSGTDNSLDREKRDKLWETDFKDLRSARVEALAKMIKYQVDQAHLAEKTGDSLNLQMNTIVLIVAILGFVVSLGGGILLAHLLAKQCLSIAKSIDEGSNNVAGASGQLAQAAQTLASGATESAASLEEGVASIDELSSMVKRNVSSIEQAAALSQ